MTTTVVGVKGMTCGHCVASVTEEVSAIGGVTSVAVELIPGDVSVVTGESSAELSAEDIAAAVDEAGYEIAESQ